MFIYENGVFKSSLLVEQNVPHGFSTRVGGISVKEHTKTMNVGFNRGDDDETVVANIEILKKLSGAENTKTVYFPQIHSNIVRKIECPDFISPIEPCDGAITNQKGVSILARVADCTPILFYGNGVVAAVHAGWRGTVARICESAVSAFNEYGVKSSDITVAIGHCIHSCCFEVKEDFVEAVTSLCGSGFANRHICKSDKGLFANMVSMNVEILNECGVTNIDVSNHCTSCNPSLFHSHRKTNGNRGTMGALISLPE